GEGGCGPRDRTKTTSFTTAAASGAGAARDTHPVWSIGTESCSTTFHATTAPAGATSQRVSFVSAQLASSASGWAVTGVLTNAVRRLSSRRIALSRLAAAITRLARRSTLTDAEAK